MLLNYITIFRRLKIFTIYFCIKGSYIKLQNRIELMETPITQAIYLCTRYRDTYHHLHFSDFLNSNIEDLIYNY
jgi:hypothetical protein